MKSTDTHEKRSASGLDKILAAIFYGATSFAVIFVNKSVLTNYNFPYFDFLALFQFLVTTFILGILIILRKVDVPMLNITITKEILPISLMFLCNILFGLGGTKSLNLPMFTVLRRFSILFTMIAESLILQSHPSNPVIISVLMMVFGAILAAFYDLKFDMIGYIMIFLNNIFTTLNGVWMKKASISGRCSKMGILFYNSLFSSMIMLSFFMIEYMYIEYQNTAIIKSGYLRDSQLIHMNKPINTTQRNMVTMSSSRSQQVKRHLRDIFDNEHSISMSINTSLLASYDSYIPLITPSTTSINNWKDSTLYQSFYIPFNNILKEYNINMYSYIKDLSSSSYINTIDEYYYNEQNYIAHTQAMHERRILNEIHKYTYTENNNNNNSTRTLLGVDSSSTTSTTATTTNSNSGSSSTSGDNIYKDAKYISTLTQLWYYPEWTNFSFLTTFLLAACMGSLLNYSIFLCTTINSALTTSVVGCLKNVATTYIGMFVFPDYSFQLFNFIGLNISIIGSLYYTYVTMVKGLKGFGGG